MSIKCGFFNSVNNDRLYNADDISNYFEGLVSDGVYINVGQACVVKAGGGLNVTVGTGRAIIGNKWVRIDTPQVLRLFPDASLSKYISICIKLDLGKRKISLVTESGKASTSPIPPTLINTEKIKYLRLADVLLHANTTTILQSCISDTRPYSGCGWVTGLVHQVDTSELFLQFQTAYEEKLQEINKWKSDLDKDGLFARVEELFQKIEELENSTNPDNAFTQTKGGAIRNITYSEPVVLDVGFAPKTFELIGIGDGSGIYLQWDKTNGWTGNEGPLYDYNINLSNNTVSINTHMLLECNFIWRAFG